MITVCGIEYTEAQIKESITNLERTLKSTKELVLESLDNGELHAKSVKRLELRIDELNAHLNNSPSVVTL